MIKGFFYMLYAVVLGFLILPGHLIIGFLNFISFYKLEKRYSKDENGFVKYINDSLIAGFLLVILISTYLIWFGFCIIG